MENEHSVVEGFLLLPPIGKVLKKSWQKKYCILYDKSSTGVARIEIFENNNSQSHTKIIPLEDVIEITKKIANIINVVTKSSTFEFETLSEKEFTKWFDSLMQVAFSARSDYTSVEQENDLYCSSDEGVFVVKLHSSEASERCKLPSQNYILVVATSSLQLKDERQKVLCTWPFSYIRKYGYKQGKFNFEAGRKCSTGEGVFIFEHSNYNEIYRCVAAKMKNMRKLLGGAESSPSLIDCKDFHAALNMEPGSRSPLPSSFQSFQEPFNKSTLQSHFFSVRPLSLVDCLKTTNKEIPKKPARKTLPLKPPRQVALPQTYASNISTKEFGKYDQVESRTDAWKTLGLDEPVHYESEKRDLPVEMYIPWAGSDASQQEINCGAPAVITEPTSSESALYYDRLQHFGSSSTLNSNPGYKTIPKHLSVENLPSTNYPEIYFDTQEVFFNTSKSGKELQFPTIVPAAAPPGDESYDHLDHFGKPLGPNDGSSDYKQVASPMPMHVVKDLDNCYEEVGVGINQQPGYGKIQKDPFNDTTKMVLNELKDRIREEAQRVAYKYHNNQPYAVVSKPKRV